MVQLRRRRIDDFIEQPDLRAGLERQRSGEHLIQHHAKREDIGSRAYASALRLLGRHVRHGAHHRARPRQKRHGCGGSIRINVGLLELGQAEIQQLYGA